MVDFVRATSVDPTTMASVFSTSEVTERSVMEWVEHVVEVAPIFQQMRAPNVSEAYKGKGTSILVQKKNTMPP